jgi:hypothetical protein
VENVMNGSFGKFVRLFMMTVAGGLLLVGTLLARGPTVRATFDRPVSCPHTRLHSVKMGILKLVLAD